MIYLGDKKVKNIYFGDKKLSKIYLGDKLVWQKTELPPIVYEAVDLGLPNGTKWATMNVGASKPSDTGLYFQWGDTVGYTANQVGTGEGQKEFASDWSDYKWNPSGDGETFTKYIVHNTLELEDDAAHVNMGGSWHMPTPTQIQELLDNTTSTWTTSDGVTGMTFASKKDTSKFIFIPAAGSAWGDSVQSSGDYGDVWSSMQFEDIANTGQGLSFRSDNASLDYYNRYSGFSVRGVIEKSGNVNGHSYVDLDLPSGTIWATMNVGASKPSDYGLYFQWGDIVGYTKDQVGKYKRFDWNNYKFSIDGSSTNFSKYGSITLQLEEDDAAHVHMGGNWHMPTKEQILELFGSTDYKFTTLNGVSGITFTSIEDDSKSIFIPSAGKALNGSIIQSGNGVGIWINQLSSNDNGFCLYLDSSGDGGFNLPRYYGLSVRGVIG